MERKWKEKIKFIVTKISRKWNFIQSFNNFIFFKFNSLLNNISSEPLKKETLSRKFGNEMFRKKNLYLAIEFYNLSLSIVSLSKKTERSFCFSNRAQCLLGLDRKEYTLTDCSSAIKLVNFHEKSWYRKNFVYNIKKDYIGNFFNFLKMYTLSRFFGKFFIFIRIEPLLKFLTRFERNLSKEKCWKKVQLKKRNRQVFFSENSGKNLPQWNSPGSSCISANENFLGTNVLLPFLFKIFSLQFLFFPFFLKNLIKFSGNFSLRNQIPKNLAGSNSLKISYQTKPLIAIYPFLPTKITGFIFPLNYFEIKAKKVKFLC
mmetsp:Transcript_28807/g.59051  ORF Transcript_28807/g.59051 Transcript_28807/m.59051 type:complete len:316 (+) Transcript_28807:57-1004(+)